MSKTGAELKLHTIKKDQGVEVFDDATEYAPVIESGKLIMCYSHDTGGVDEHGNPVIARKREIVSVTQASLTALCSGVASVLSGTVFTGEDVETVFKSAFESATIG